jgi:xanthine dehydrogenase YagT iron-sulfur-binding subunit
MRRRRAMQKKPRHEDPKTGITRRSFIKGVGVGAAAAAAASGTLTALAEAKEAKAEEMQKLTLRVNGRSHRLLVEPRWSLLFVLREKLGLTGTKVGCERGECGACTVLINGVPRYACLTLALEAEGEEITTVEGLMEGEELGPVQQAFLENDAFQCGYCTPGQIMAAEGLLRAGSPLTVGEIQKGMSGNLCRCGAYAHIFRAVETAAKARSGK